MVNRGLLAAVGALVLSSVMVISCNKKSPVTPSVSLAGTWYAKGTAVSNQGINDPDTFSTSITITGNTYFMQRTTYLHSSSGGNADSVNEYGTLTTIPAGTGISELANGDSVVFTPTTTVEYLNNFAAWDTCTSLGVPCQASTVSQHKVHIVDSAGGVFWGDSFPDCSGEDYILWHLKKQ